MKVCDGRAAAVAHARTDAADKLEYGVFDGAFVGYTAFHAFRYEFFGIFLEIAVFAAVFHGSERTHAAVTFVFAALEQLEGARGFVTAGKYRAHHADICSGSERFCHVAGIFDAAVCNNRNVMFFCSLVAVHDCSNLWDADTGNDPCRTDRARPDADLDTVCPCFNQRFGCFPGGNVSGNYL